MEKRLEINKHHFDIKLDDIVEYQNAINYMYNRQILLKQKQEPEMLWILEHPLIYTGGKLANHAEILDKNINTLKTSRGGKWTCHSEGQIIIYFVYDIKGFFAKKNKITNITDFVNKCENILSELLLEYNIENFTNLNKNRGIWIKDQENYKKIISIGLSVSKNIITHGISINFSNNLEYFNNIIICGIKDNTCTNLIKLGINENKLNFKNKILQIFTKNLFF